MKNILYPTAFFTSILIVLFLGQFIGEYNYFLISLGAGVISVLFLVFKSQRFIGIILLFAMFGSLIGATRLHFAFQEKDKNHISNFLDNEEKITIYGRICDEVDRRTFNTKYTICANLVKTVKKEESKKAESLVKELGSLESYESNQDSLSSGGKGSDDSLSSGGKRSDDSLSSGGKRSDEGSTAQAYANGYIAPLSGTQNDKINSSDFTDFTDYKKSHGKILVNNERYPIFEYGDFVKIEGYLKTAPDMEDFSYKNYLSRYEIYGIVQYGKISLIEPENKKAENLTKELASLQNQELNQNNSQNIQLGEKLNSNNFDNSTFFGKIVYRFYGKIFETKEKFLERIGEIYPEPHGSFLSGLLVGARKGLPQEIQEDFQKNGLAHIVAISGYNITLIIVIIARIFAFLPKNISFYISSISIIIFTIFVGASSAVVRAAIMGILMLLALKFGRPNVIFVSGLVAATAISLFNPKILWWDLGFQLSFLALIGVIYVSPMFENISKKIPETLALKESFILTIAASITTFPLLAYHFGFISLISPVANIFVAPLTPLAMLFGFFSIISPFPFLEKIFGFITYSLLDLALYFSHFFAKMEYSVVNFKIGEIGVVISFLLMLILILVFHLHFKEKEPETKMHKLNLN